MRVPSRGLTRRQFVAGAAAGGLWLAGCGGRGLPSARRRGELRIVHYSDVHARPEWDTPLALERARDAINALEPDLVVATGDLITDGFQSSAATAAPRWDVYMTLHDGIEADVFPAIGNHDLVAALPEDGTPPAADPRAVARERLRLARTFYRFDAGGHRFFVLDSIEVIGGELKYRGFVGEEQQEWLRAELSHTPRDMPIVLALHVPLLTTFYAATEGATFPAPANRVVVNNREVLALFQGHRLALVLQGHLHVQELVRWRDTTFAMGGAICGRWWRGDWFGTHPGFGLVTLQDGRVDWEYVEYGWEPRRPADA